MGFLDELEQTDTLADTTETADERDSTLEPPSAFMEVFRDSSESCSHGDVAAVTSARMLMNSPRRQKIEGAARVLSWGHFLRTNGKCIIAIMKFEPDVK